MRAPDYLKCDRCDSIGLGPVLHDALWKRLGNPRLLCLPCIESALGRLIVRGDLKLLLHNGYFGRWIEE